MRFVPKIFLMKLVWLTLFFSAKAFASSKSYSQIVLPFDSERPFAYHYNRAENAVVLEIEKTRTSELKALETYDETLIRRLYFSESAHKTTVKIVLKDKSVRATITSFKEPYRIVLDLFQKGYKEARDPKTGFPFSTHKPKKSGRKNSLDHPASFGKNTHEIEILEDDFEEQEPARMQTSFSKEQGFAKEDKRKHRLLKPTSDQFSNSQELSQALANVPAGRGKSWGEYPPYIYRLQLASLNAGKNYKDFLRKNAANAMTSARSMADYASKLYDFGDEQRALLAFRKVLHKSPLLFDKYPLYLWRLAEIHMGKGNLTLADGYYGAMVTKHPDHPLANFAKMRRFDIKAIRLIKKGEAQAYDVLASHLDRIDPKNDVELKAQIAIRQVYWSADKENQTKLLKNKYHIPPISSKRAVRLEGIYSQIENPWTGLLCATLTLNKRLDKDTPWHETTSNLAGHYFKKYQGKKLETYRKHLWAKMTEKLNDSIEKHVGKKDYIAAISIYDSLPQNLRKVKNEVKTSWALGEAYRLLGRPSKAVDFYQDAAKRMKMGEEKFKALFWQAVTTNDKAAAGNIGSKNIQKALRVADRAMMAAWRGLKPQEKRNLLVSMKGSFEEVLNSQMPLYSPVEILLQGYKDALSSKVEESGSKLKNLKESYSPVPGTVGVLDSIAKKMDRLGARKKANDARLLLSKLHPKDFNKDKDIENLWANNLISLAETYRAASKFLDAGRIYALTGEKSENFEGRAEALYKGGLLLYRAGRREEAIKAFEQASQDGNNLLYSDLATKRLNQINQ